MEEAPAEHATGLAADEVYRDIMRAVPPERHFTFSTCCKCYGQLREDAQLERHAQGFLRALTKMLGDEAKACALVPRLVQLLPSETKRDTLLRVAAAAATAAEEVGGLSRLAVSSGTYLAPSDAAYDEELDEGEETEARHSERTGSERSSPATSPLDFEPAPPPPPPPPQGAAAAAAAAAAATTAAGAAETDAESAATVSTPAAPPASGPPPFLRKPSAEDARASAQADRIGGLRAGGETRRSSLEAMHAKYVRAGSIDEVAALMSDEDIWMSAPAQQHVLQRCEQYVRGLCNPKPAAGGDGERLLKAWHVVSVNEYLRRQPRVLVLCSHSYYRVKWDAHTNRVKSFTRVAMSDVVSVRYDLNLGGESGRRLLVYTRVQDGNLNVKKKFALLRKRSFKGRGKAGAGGVGAGGGADNPERSAAACRTYHALLPAHCKGDQLAVDVIAEIAQSFQQVHYINGRQ
eukprot:g2029.t1